LVLKGDSLDEELKNWLSYLAVKTAIGSVEDKSDLEIEISIHLDVGAEQVTQSWTQGIFDRENKIIGYPFPQAVLTRGEDTAVIDGTPAANKHNLHNRKHQAIWHEWSANDIIEDTNLLDESEKEALSSQLLWVKGYLGYSTDMLKDINKRLGGRSNLIKHGMRLASDGTPQGRILDLSLTSSQGLDRQCHIVLGFENLELDTGRKISANETIVNAISKIGSRVIAVLKLYRWAMKKPNRPEIASDLVAWRASVDARSSTSLIRQIFEVNHSEPVFRVEPSNESEVIALFVAMLSLGLLKGYKLQAISGFNRYDALLDIDTSSDEVCQSNDPLSVENNPGGMEGEGKVLEFKFDFQTLFNDFENNKKNPSEIDVLVCWSVSRLNVARGRIEPSYGSWKDHRQIYGGSYIWSDENDTSCIQVIALKNAISELLAEAEILLGSAVPALVGARHWLCWRRRTARPRYEELC